MKNEYYRLSSKKRMIEQKMKSLIISAIKENSGRITLIKEEDEDNYPLTTILSGKKDIYFISITDAYLDEHDAIYVDGVDDDTCCVKTAFIIYPEQYSDILYFIGYVLGWQEAKEEEQALCDNINSNIMELACELAEKEMVDTHNWLPEAFMDTAGENYTADFQEEFNLLYDKYYNRITELADFQLK